MESNKPVHTLSYGTTRVTIWKYTSDLGEYFKIGVHSIFTRNGKWEKNSYFSEYDLLTLSKAILDAHAYIQNHRSPDEQSLCMPKVVGDDDDVPSIEN